MARYGVRFENDPSLTPQDFQELGRLAEDLGYETVWVPEGGGRDSLTALAAIALKTERVRLGTGILPIYARTATNTAMGAAGMAAVSGDRFILGLGVGHRPTVEGRDGVPFRQPMARLRETISIVQGLLSGDTVAPRRGGTSTSPRLRWEEPPPRNGCPSTSPRWGRRCWSWPERWPTAC